MYIYFHDVKLNHSRYSVAFSCLHFDLLFTVMFYRYSPLTFHLTVLLLSPVVYKVDAYPFTLLFAVWVILKINAVLSCCEYAGSFYDLFDTFGKTDLLHSAIVNCLFFYYFESPIAFYFEANENRRSLFRYEFGYALKHLISSIEILTI